MVIGLFLIVTGVVIVNIYKTETQLTELIYFRQSEIQLKKRMN